MIWFVGPRQTETVSITGARSAIATSSQSFSQKAQKDEADSAAAASFGIEAAKVAPLELEDGGQNGARIAPTTALRRFLSRARGRPVRDERGQDEVDQTTSPGSDRLGRSSLIE